MESSAAAAGWLPSPPPLRHPICWGMAGCPGRGLKPWRHFSTKCSVEQLRRSCCRLHMTDYICALHWCMNALIHSRCMQSLTVTEHDCLICYWSVTNRDISTLNSKFEIWFLRSPEDAALESDQQQLGLSLLGSYLVVGSVGSAQGLLSQILDSRGSCGRLQTTAVFRISLTHMLCDTVEKRYKIMIMSRYYFRL